MIRSIILLLLVFVFFTVQAQQQIQFSLTDRNGAPVSGALIRLHDNNAQTSSDEQGRFYINVTFLPDTVSVSHMGFENKVLYLTTANQGATYVLEYKQTELDDVVVSTGYYETSQRDATGSFDYVGQEELEQIVSGDIVSKLEGLVTGVQFSREGYFKESKTNEPDIRVRGVNSIYSNTSPLIILDNFPFEGDISSISPDEIESITILKDAAAASIWGARAGNGVIVITSKRGRYNQKTKITYQGSFNTTEKPDLFYDRAQLPLNVRMELEKEFFENNVYTERDWIPLTDYVELLIRKRDGTISDAEFTAIEADMKRRDVRREASDLLYRNQTMQQNSISINGGSDRISYFLSAGYDEDKGMLRGDRSNRLNLTSSNRLKLAKNLELTTNIRFTTIKGEENGLSFSDIQPSRFSLPFYSQLRNEMGEALAIPNNLRKTYVDNAEAIGLVNWDYKPLDEIRHADNTFASKRTMLEGGLTYRFLKNFSSQVKYQYWIENREQRNYYSEDTYFTRDLVNQFTQADGEQVIPYGGILMGNNSYNSAHSGRFQLDYNNTVADHRIKALAGAEVRQDFQGSTPGYVLYGYDNSVLTSMTTMDFTKAYPLRPRGSSRILFAPPNTIMDITDRFVSYYGNAGYSYKGKYAASVSSRWDASNLFGVKTNQKGTPLWSVGGSWEISKENFYSVGWLPYLKLRLTYGSNGNINRAVSVFPKITYQISTITDLQYATLRSAGNPGLRWERVATFNAGLDFSAVNNRISGSLDIYKKNSTDLIGYDLVDPTTGIFDANGYFEIDNRLNYANMTVNGVDIGIHTLNIDMALKWHTSFLFSFVKNEITDYMEEQSSSISAYWSNPPPEVGRSKDVLYAIPWNGLDGNDGSPIIYIDGERSDDYALYIRQLEVDDLIEAGVRVPRYYGSVKNTLTWNNFSASANIMWKAGYVFRRTSAGYAGLPEGNGHLDYAKRWQKPGDELHTSVPSRPEVNSAPRDQAYLVSERLVEKGDHIRLHDLSIGYTFYNKKAKVPVDNLHLFTYAKNMGVLWRANKHGLDPDFPTATYPQPKSVALGLKIQF